MKNIILYGAPAAGKGTQSELLVQKYGYVNISIGELLRNMDDNTPLGKEVKELISKGILVDDNITVKLLKEKIDSISDKNIILDGFPRNINQVNLLNDILSNYIVISIDVDKDVAMKRALGRLTCDNCKKIYNIYTPAMIPKEKNTCDVCKGNLSARGDDNEESFTTRFNIYSENVHSILDYYKNKNILYTVKSYESPSETFNEIENILKENND